jgi:LPS-assembly protein
MPDSGIRYTRPRLIAMAGGPRRNCMRCGHAAILCCLRAPFVPTGPDLRRLRLIFAAALCAAAATAHGAADEASCPQLELPPMPEARTSDDVDLTADEAVLERGGLSRLLGSVRLRHEDREFSAESLTYDDIERRVRIRAENLFRNRDFIIRSQVADFYLEQRVGEFQDTEFTLIERAARGTARSLEIEATGRARLERVAYTTCAPGDDSWVLEAGRISLDHERGLGTARHARLRFAKVPILYVPYLRFPIDNRRRTGFLFPTVGQSTRTGFDFRWPVYFNLAPQYDAMLTPRYMSRRGLQLGSEFRYLMTSATGRAAVDILPDDQQTNERRSLTEFSHEGLLSERLALDAEYASVSDSAYFEDLGGRLDISALTHLERRARMVYQAPAAYSVQVMLQGFQTLDTEATGADLPYRRLPQVLAQAQTRNEWFNTRAGVHGEYVNFVGTDVVEGQRVTVVPNLRTALDQTSWYFTAQLDLHLTQYLLSGGDPELDKEPRRTLPLFSAESGLRFERSTRKGWLQTLEPRGIYLYAPFRNQSQIPLFDSGEPDFDIVQLFARNRFSGVDRISDANHVAGAVTSRLLDPDTGSVRLTATVGQLLRLHAPRVDLPDAPPPDSGATDFIAAVDYRLTPRWVAAMTTQWAPGEQEFNRLSTQFRYRDGNRRADVGYRFRRDILEQADLAVGMPIMRQWSAIGRWRYSLQDSRSLETLAGVEYETCCWAARATWRRYIANIRGEFDTSIYLQLELKGLARIGGGFTNLLPPLE